VVRRVRDVGQPQHDRAFDVGCGWGLDGKRRRAGRLEAGFGFTNGFGGQTYPPWLAMVSEDQGTARPAAESCE
jgi:hypothetical protein